MSDLSSLSPLTPVKTNKGRYSLRAASGEVIGEAVTSEYLLVPRVYILWYHQPQEAPDFHGVFSTLVRAQMGVDPSDAGGERLWQPMAGNEHTCWTLGAPVPYPFWYVTMDDLDVAV